MDVEARRKELVATFDGVDDVKTVVLPLIDDVVFIEEQLEQLRGLPFMRVNPSNKVQQKPTPAAKMYKELLQQYNNCIKILAGVLRKDVPEEESPLRAWVNSRAKND